MSLDHASSLAAPIQRPPNSIAAPHADGDYPILPLQSASASITTCRPPNPPPTPNLHYYPRSATGGPARCVGASVYRPGVLSPYIVPVLHPNKWWTGPALARKYKGDVTPLAFFGAVVVKSLWFPLSLPAILLLCCAFFRVVWDAETVLLLLAVTSFKDLL